MLNDRTRGFAALGKLIHTYLNSDSTQAVGPARDFFSEMDFTIQRASAQNPWFTVVSCRQALAAIAVSLSEKSLLDWLVPYNKALAADKPVKTVGLVMAGNIPLVGFHDFLCVLMSGNKALVKLSSSDNILLPFLAKALVNLEPGLAGSFEFTEGKLSGMDAIIATGSNNSAQYFQHYFGAYPHIIRHNRNSVAILNGKESKEELYALGHDIFDYFGLGCRNVSKLFVPEYYRFDSFFEGIIGHNEVAHHNKYVNNYEYNKTVYLMNSTPGLLDNNFVLLKEDTGLSSPIGVLFYEYYSDVADLQRKLEMQKNELQCIVGDTHLISEALPFGTAQCPQLADYADGIDTMAFLLNL